MSQELKPYRFSWKEQLAQLLTGDQKIASPWGQFVENVVGTSMTGPKMGPLDFTPVGMAFSANQSKRALDRGDYGDAVLEGVGALPLPAVLAGSKNFRTAFKDLNLLNKVNSPPKSNPAERVASRATFIHNVPDRPQRPIDLDYKNAQPNDGYGNLSVDRHGNPLVAKYIAGRRVVGGPDVPLSPQDVASMAEKATGRYPEAVAAREIGGDAGRYVVERNPRTNEVLNRAILYDQKLDERTANRVVTHEFGHLLDEMLATVDISGLDKEVRTLYNDLNNPQSYGKMWGPENAGYKTKEEVRRELVGEAFRAYIENPNYIKVVAPKTADRLSKKTNTHPVLKNIIQLNTNPATIAAGGTGILGAGLLNPDQ